MRLGQCAQQSSDVVEVDDVVGDGASADRGLRHAGVSGAVGLAAMTVPPKRWIAVAPVAASEPPPVSTTAIARGPAAVAGVFRRAVRRRR